MRRNAKVRVKIINMLEICCQPSTNSFVGHKTKGFANEAGKYELNEFLTDESSATVTQKPAKIMTKFPATQ